MSILVSEVIKQLSEFQIKYGDQPVHLEVGENVDCRACDQTTYKSMCGMLNRVTDINIHGVGICAWLLANKG